jgi:hypothetical protein
MVVMCDNLTRIRRRSNPRIDGSFPFSVTVRVPTVALAASRTLTVQSPGSSFSASGTVHV